MDTVVLYRDLSGINLPILDWLMIGLEFTAKNALNLLPFSRRPLPMLFRAALSYALRNTLPSIELLQLHFDLCMADGEIIGSITIKTVAVYPGTGRVKF